MADVSVQATDLQGAELFRGLETATLGRLAALASLRKISQGQSIFVLGQEARQVYLLRSGRVGLFLPIAVSGGSQSVTVQQKHPNEIIGWSALVPPHQYTMGARAEVETELIGFSRADLVSWFESDHRSWALVMANLAQTIAGRLSQLQVIMLRDLQRWVAERMES
jgi:CRP-like cAMP-binding protein